MGEQHNLIKEAIETVEHAQKAVIEAQGNNNQQEFQEAEQLLHRAQELVREAKGAKVEADSVARREFIHAEELLRHLLEAKQSIQH